MARHQFDDEPMYFKPYVPGKVVVSVPWFIALCILAFVGTIFIAMMLLGV